MAEGIRAPWWLKPANDVYKVLLRRGEQVPAGVAFLKRSGLVANGTTDEVEALAGTCPVFRIDPIT